ncbi:hypothetical protein G6F32_017325 [Rhizopus arrhizus]|nr:hypothetical protein G6F32_017325 [Rhizopus arrhizus]
MCVVGSEGTGQAQDVFGDVGQDQVGRDWRHLIQPRFAELALDVVLGRKAETTVELQAGVGGFPRGVGSQQLGHVGLGAARLVG